MEPPQLEMGEVGAKSANVFLLQASQRRAIGADVPCQKTQIAVAFPLRQIALPRSLPPLSRADL